MNIITTLLRLHYTYADKERDDDEHGGQVDGDDALEVLVLVEVCAVADEAEDDGGDDDVEEDPEQLPLQRDLHPHLHRYSTVQYSTVQYSTA